MKPVIPYRGPALFCNTARTKNHKMPNPQPAHTSTRQPTIIFIFGGSGDLTYRKLMPALYNLFLDRYLPEKFLIEGIGRTEFTHASFQNHSKKGVEEHSRLPERARLSWKEFAHCIEYMKADLDDDK